MYNIYIICISLRMRVHVCVRHLPTDCDRINRSSFENYSIRVFLFPSKNPSPSSPSFLSMGSIRHLVFSTSLTTRENERIIGQGTRVRSHMAPRFFQTFLSYPPPVLGKENCPKIADRRAIAAMGKRSSFFFFFLLPFSTLIRERKKKQKKNPKRAKFFNSFENRKSGEREFKSDLECIRRESAIGRQSCNRFYLFYFGRLRIVHRYTSIYRLHLTHATYT